MGKISRRLSSLILCGWSALLPAAEAPSGAVLVDATTGKHICNAVYIQPQTVALPLHCLSDLDPNHVRVRTVPGGTDWKVSSIRSIVTREGYFPSYDISLLTMEKPWPRFKALPLGPDGWPQKGHYVLEVFRPDQTQKIRIPLKKRDTLEGFRITPLVRVEAEGAELPCYGDSGGPVYLEGAGPRRLLGFLTGLSAPLTPSSFDCKDRLRLLTPLGPYREWMAGGPPPFQKPGPTRFANLEEACRTQSLSDPTWPDIQDLILSLKPKEEGLLRCQGLSLLWNEAVGSVSFKFSTVLNADAYPFLKGVKNAVFQAVDAKALMEVARWQGLESLTLNGLDEGMDLSPLQGLKALRRLKLLHGQGLMGLKKNLEHWPVLETLEIYNATLADKGELDRIKKERSLLKISIDQVQRLGP